MGEVKKTERIKIRRSTKEHNSGYSFTSEFKYRDARKNGQFAKGDVRQKKKFIETPSGDRIENLEQAYNHIKNIVD